MNEQKNFFSESKHAIEQYLQDRLLLIKLQLTEKISKLVALIFTGMLIGMLIFFIILFLSIMAGYYFAYLTGNMYLGFAIVAAFYLILLITIILLRKKVIEKGIVNTIIKIMFEKHHDEHESKQE